MKRKSGFWMRRNLDPRIMGCFHGPTVYNFWENSKVYTWPNSVSVDEFKSRPNLGSRYWARLSFPPWTSYVIKTFFSVASCIGFSWFFLLLLFNIQLNSSTSSFHPLLPVGLIIKYRRQVHHERKKFLRGWRFEMRFAEKPLGISRN